MSIVLFVSAAAFTDYMMESAEGGLASDQFDLIYAAESDASSAMTPDALLELLFSEQNVTGGTYTKKQFLQGDISREYVTAMFADRFPTSAWSVRTQHRRSSASPVICTSLRTPSSTGYWKSTT